MKVANFLRASRRPSLQTYNEDVRGRCSVVTPSYTQLVNRSKILAVLYRMRR
jgi:hypothetical protein